MTDQYRISDAVPAQSPRTQGSALRIALWLTLFVSAGANAASSSFGFNPFIGAAFGLVTLGSIAALIVHHYRTR